MRNLKVLRLVKVPETELEIDLHGFRGNLELEGFTWFQMRAYYAHMSDPSGLSIPLYTENSPIIKQLINNKAYLKFHSKSNITHSLFN